MAPQVEVGSSRVEETYSAQPGPVIAIEDADSGAFQSDGPPSASSSAPWLPSFPSSLLRPMLEDVVPSDTDEAIVIDDAHDPAADLAPAGDAVPLGDAAPIVEEIDVLSSQEEPTAALDPDGYLIFIN